VVFFIAFSRGRVLGRKSNAGIEIGEIKNARLTFDAEIHSGETPLSDAWRPQLVPLEIKQQPSRNLPAT